MKFCEQKATEAAAYILQKAGNALEVMKLMKLMYLSERRSVQEYGDLLIGDQPISFEHGPMLRTTYDLSKMKAGSSYWKKHISRSGNDIRLNVPIEYKNLSKADTLILDSIWNEFGDFTSFELSDYTHDNCSEWTYPGKSSAPISLMDFIESTGYDEDLSRMINNRILEQRSLSIAIDWHTKNMSGD